MATKEFKKAFTINELAKLTTIIDEKSEHILNGMTPAWLNKK